MQTKWLQLTCLSVFSLLTIASANATDYTRIIPSVKLSAAINKINQRAEIRWFGLPKEYNMLRFEVQKSADGSNFSYITSVAANRGSSIQQYFAEDRNLQQGNNFYRLRIVFKDGTERYSPVIQMASTDPGVTVLPAIAEDKVYIWMPENTHVSTASIIDISGQVIFKNATIQSGSGLANIDVTRLSPGFYNLVIELSPSQKIHLKFSKK